LICETGFTAFQLVDRRGDVTLLVPELNFFAVLKQSISTGRREIYSNIEIREPDPSLFLPPPNAAVEPLPGPRGILRRPRG
jgi:hypothetical protein